MWLKIVMFNVAGMSKCNKGTYNFLCTIKKIVTLKKIFFRDVTKVWRICGALRALQLHMSTGIQYFLDWKESFIVIKRTD